MNAAEWKLFIRSGKGQLWLMASVYVGAVGLAVTALCLRGILFERFVREKPVAVSERVQRNVERVRSGEAIDDFTKEERDQLYSGLIAGDLEDGDNRLAKLLIRLDGETILERLRRTLVAGNPDQRRRAVEIMAEIENPQWRERVLQLGRYARDRAEHRGETELAGRAEEVVKKLGS